MKMSAMGPEADLQARVRKNGLSRKAKLERLGPGLSNLLDLLGAHMTYRFMHYLQRLLRWIGRTPRDVVLTIIGFALGVATSHFYYLRSLDDARSEAVESRRSETLLLRAIGEVGDLEYTRDDSGRAVGIAIRLRGHASGITAATGNLSVAPPERSPD